MRIRLRNMVLGLMALAVSGCGLMQTELEKAVNQTSALHNTCLNLPVTPADMRDEHRKLLSDLAEAWLGLGNPELGRGAAAGNPHNYVTVRDKLSGLRKAFSDFYANSKQETRPHLKPIHDDIEDVEARVKAIRASIKTIVAGVRNFGRTDLPIQLIKSSGSVETQAITGLFAVNTLKGLHSNQVVSEPVLPANYLYAGNFLVTMMAATEEVIVDLYGLRAAVLKLQDDIASASVALDKTVLAEAQELMNQVNNTLYFVEQLAKREIDPKKLQEIERVLKQIIWREVGFRAVDMVHRSARTIEPKLDQIDEKTWFIITLLSIVVYPSLSDQMANLIEQGVEAWADQAAIQQEAGSLLYGLAAGSCRRLSVEADTVSTDVIRADSLVRPVYVAFVSAFACMGKDGKQAANGCLKSIGKDGYSQQEFQSLASVRKIGGDFNEAIRKAAGEFNTDAAAAFRNAAQSPFLNE